MVYLYINSHSIKVLVLKKTLLGQQETLFFEKKHEATLIENGKVVNVDILASAIKEALNFTSTTPLNDKQVVITLPQESFYFLRTEVPNDIAESAIQSFVNDKARASLPVDIDQCANDYFVQENDNQKTVSLYAIDKDTLQSFQQALTLIDLKITAIIPETLAIYKLFDKTLRKEKKELIFYVSYEENSLLGFLFDSSGLIDPKLWKESLKKDDTVETVLKQKADFYLNNKQKLNRLILSGKLSETIRQDTFTKAVGVWTNPLKRIIPTFYKEYLKMLVMNNNTQFPLLSFDVCFGSFIFNTENKSFSLTRKRFPSLSPKTSFSLPKINLPMKEIMIFVVSFIASLILFIFLSNSKIALPNFNFGEKKITVTPTTTSQSPTPTPTPSFKKEDLKIKILNGSGTAGKATEVKDIIKKIGYQDIVTGNADNFDYTTSELQVKKSKSAATMMLQKDLTDYVSSFKTSTLDEKESADVVIIIGADFK
jgi:hypothetical protein